MRMRNKPWAMDFLLAHSKVIQDPSVLKGKWKTEYKQEVLQMEAYWKTGRYSGNS